MRIAIIPARGGSKRIPRKNIRPFAGKPMIAYAIAAAKEARVFDRIIVSTDDDEIMDVARQYGAEVPFVRPAHLSDDHTPTVPVVAHAITEVERLVGTVEAACCIYPCVPFLDCRDLLQSLCLLNSGEADYSFPVAAFPAAPQRSLKLDRERHTSPFFPEHQLTRSQDLEPAYFDAGQFYWGRRAAWLSNPRIYDSACGLVIPGWRVVDIDTPDDWTRAELMHIALRRTAGMPAAPVATNGETHAV